MAEFITEYYMQIKSMHLISVIAWFAGLFYLPRIFVYHTEQKQVTEAGAIFKIMEFKLYKYIMMPAMILSYVFGLMMLYENSYLLLDGFSYFHIKLTAVLVLTAYHFSLAYFIKLLKADNFKYSGKFFRIYNEIPTILLFVIIFLVIVKPF